MITSSTLTIIIVKCYKKKQKNKSKNKIDISSSPNKKILSQGPLNQQDIIEQIMMHRKELLALRGKDADIDVVELKK